MYVRLILVVCLMHSISAAELTQQCNDVEVYEKLSKKLKDLSSLQGINGLLTWDELVMMPPGATNSRASQKAALAGVIHDKETDKELGNFLDSLSPPGDALDEWQKAVVREAKRGYKRATAIPKDLAERIARLESEAYVAWVEARKESNFSKFAPFLQQWVDICKEKAKLINPDLPVYDVLLEDFEKGLTSARLDEVFGQVREQLAPMIQVLKEKGTAPDADWLNGEYDVEQQAKLCRVIALDLGFDLDKGRLDVSVHPFTGGAHPTDVRMTTRFKAHDLTEGLTGAIHETGHALYEQGRNPKYDGLPVNQAMSMGIHESQSLLWERMVALSEPFCHYLYPKITSHFPNFPEWDAADLYKAINVMKVPSLIRVESDEVTYPMHIILRYEIERGLLDGSIAVDDVPKVWNQKMQQYLGVTPENDAKGCLQDVHWSSGAFGYFPTYSLGAMYACQIYQKAKESLPGLEENIAKGNFTPLREWLNHNIHEKGSLYENGDLLMEAVTGKKLDPSCFISYLRDKYTKLYQL